MSIHGAKKLLRHTRSCYNSNNKNDNDNDNDNDRNTLTRQLHNLILKQKLRFDVYNDFSGCRVLEDGGDMLRAPMFNVDLKKKNVQTSLSKDKDMSVDIYTDSSAHTRDNQEYAASYKLDSCGMFRQYKYIFGAQRM